MAVVINELEVVPAAEPRSASAAPAQEGPPPEPKHELERAVEVRRERDLRLRAD